MGKLQVASSQGLIWGVVAGLLGLTPGLGVGLLLPKHAIKTRPLDWEGPEMSKSSSQRWARASSNQLGSRPNVKCWLPSTFPNKQRKPWAAPSHTLYILYSGSHCPAHSLCRIKVICLCNSVPQRMCLLTLKRSQSSRKLTHYENKRKKKNVSWC